jgi:hypothetical protein
MQTLEELNNHYKAVRARLNCGPKTVLAPVVVAKPVAVKVKFKPAPVMKQHIPKELLFSPAQFIMYEVALKHGITIQDIKDHSHKKKFVEARQEAAYLMQSQLKLSLPMIGRVIGKRDHTTILHAIRQYKAKIVSRETTIGE